MSTTTTITLSPTIRAALLQSVEMNIDMLNDMALDDLWLNGKQIRELAEMSEAGIRTTMKGYHDAAWKQLEQLISLQILHSELKAE